MQLAFERIQGLDRERLLQAIEPVLAAHGVEGVELVWRCDGQGRVLALTVERPGSSDPGAGVTLDLCAEISRDLSAALDAADAIPGASYRLEVGSPGLERTLYRAEDYARFAGKAARLKLARPLAGEYVVRGLLGGLDEAGRVRLDTGRAQHLIEPSQIREGSLIYGWTPAPAPGAPKGHKPGHGASQRRGPEPER